MIQRKIIKIILTILSIILMLGMYLGFSNIDKLHLEKIPFIRPFILGFETSMNIPATLCSCIITWDTLDHIPQEISNEYWWFNSINKYTRLQLKNYMKNNQLYIVPRTYLINSADDIDDLLEKLEFGFVSELKEDNIPINHAIKLYISALIKSVENNLSVNEYTKFNYKKVEYDNYDIYIFNVKECDGLKYYVYTNKKEQVFQTLFIDEEKSDIEFLIGDSVETIFRDYPNLQIIKTFNGDEYFEIKSGNIIYHYTLVQKDTQDEDGIRMVKYIENKIEMIITNHY